MGARCVARISLAATDFEYGSSSKVGNPRISLVGKSMIVSGARLTIGLRRIFDPLSALAGLVLSALIVRLTYAYHELKSH
jgi:hypothetical protein